MSVEAERLKYVEVDNLLLILLFWLNWNGECSLDRGLVLLFIAELMLL